MKVIVPDGTAINWGLAAVGLGVAAYVGNILLGIYSVVQEAQLAALVPVVVAL